MSYKHNHIIIGGTFDHFHLGHQKLINKAFELGERVTIGLAERFLFKNKLLVTAIENYKTRKKNTVDYLIKNDWLSRSKFIPIVNFYGTTLTDKTIDAIVVSRATEKNAKIINQERKKINFPELKITVISDVLAEDGGLVTSERIRLGEINDEGKNYWQSVIPACRQAGRNPQSKNNQLILPEEMREELRKPLGKVIESLKFIKSGKIPMIISVGDIVTQKLLEIGIDPDVKIIDFRTRRKQFSVSNFQFSMNFQFSKLQKYPNKAGTINIETTNKLKEVINNAAVKKQKYWLVIDGEEDLLTLPAILLAPLSSLVLYGQWDRGAVMVEVTEEMKNQVKKLLERFV